ncbi:MULTISPECIES: FAD:protein FMN transferase [Rubrivivax]|uniref:FAD:protein FMN transferase n=1 Tax=Rubrivivax benzoatilyticus TaxID=316997 RepID=A0ABX0I3G7_9BURK|nr:FAD:protein FMN transferase [Rubrivivax benzoatilyticus]EGJ09660.1 ApbE family lipoprotein [Rubrivivax benzoatilyticus JA2 = ATCC BAA-35]NHL00135.1 FAD:protein FMN transferase [Rubrivivax benzoatilyticus]NHL26086.1 FAD:protein FMN transferase [Rubrivivax benzoatilyticus]
MLMKRRTLISASLGLGALGVLAWSRRDAGPAAADALARHEGSTRAFGTTVTLTVLHADAATARTAIDAALAEVKAVDALMSLRQDGSQLVRLNRDGVLDSPDARLVAVLQAGQELSRLTGGAFDVTVQPLWRAFEAAHDAGGLPDAATIAAARAQVGWQRLQVSPERVTLAGAGMGVTVNGLAQGYAADLARAALQRHGIEHALLDTGEFTTLGAKEGGRPWMLGVREPRDAEAVAARLAMDGRALSTSGDYETVFSADFRHHHIFDPAVGDSPTELASVTVLAPTGLQADGLSTAFMVMGAERSLALAETLEGVDALLIAKDGRRWTSGGFPTAA